MQKAIFVTLLASQLATVAAWAIPDEEHAQHALKAFDPIQQRGLHVAGLSQSELKGLPQPGTIEFMKIHVSERASARIRARARGPMPPSPHPSPPRKRVAPPPV